MKRHNHQREQIDPERLFDAVDAVLEGIAQVERSTGRICPFPPDLVDSPDQPEAMRGYSKFEVEEATAFLIRLGIVELPKAK